MAANESRKYLIDTNILISGLLFNGNERDLLKLGRDQRLTLLTLDHILREFEAVLREKFEFTPQDLEVALSYILEAFETIIVFEESDLSTSDIDIWDRKNLHVIIAAKKSQAVIITGDGDLLDQDLPVLIRRCREVLDDISGSGSL